MWDEKEQGKITGTKREICRVVGCNTKELNRFIADNKEHIFSDVTNRYGKVTITNRRMNRAFLERERAKTGMRKVRKSRSYEKVTPYSSTSSSTSNNIKVCVYTLTQCIDAAQLVGLTEKTATNFFNYYDAQGWKFGNQLPIDKLPSALQRWKNKQHQFNKRFNKTDNLPTNRDYDGQFEYFWKEFKGRWNPGDGHIKEGKFIAWQQWQLLNPEEKRKAASTVIYAKGQYLPNPGRWLGDKRFDDKSYRFTAEGNAYFDSLLKGGE